MPIASANVSIAKVMPPKAIGAIGVMPFAVKNRETLSVIQSPFAQQPSRSQYHMAYSYFSLFSASAWVYHLPYNMTAFVTETISNMRFDRTADAGHKACGASFTPKAHRFPHSADGVVRRSAQARR